MKALRFLYLVAAAGVLWLLWRQYGPHAKAAVARAQGAARQDIGPNSPWRLPWQSQSQDFELLASAVADALGKTPLTIK